MIDVYQCGFCGEGVEYDTEDVQEHNEHTACKSCFLAESDTGEVY